MGIKAIIAAVIRPSPSISFMLVFGLSLPCSQTVAQQTSSIRAPGDTTLFGNPDCGHWLNLDFKVKEVWLNAILSPINMTYMNRERPATDRYAELLSLAPAVEYVDAQCKTQPAAKAMSSAINYFQVLISGKRRD